MRKNSKKFILLFLSFVLLLSPNVFAQNKEVLVCHEPISIGSSLDATLEAMDVLFKESQNIHRDIDYQIQAANTALGLIGKEAENCDTSSTTCKAICVNAQAKITLKATLLWCIDVVKYPACIPACGWEQKCSGDPCPSLKPQVSIIESSLERMRDSIQKIDDVFTSSTERMEEDIITKEEVAGVNNCLSWNRFDEKECLLKLGISEEAIHHYQWDCKPIQAQKKWDCRLILYSGLKINKIEFAQRKLERTRADFHRWRMSADDWEKVYRREITPRTTMKCLEALEARSYWPKWWTDDCKEYCKENPYSTDCQDCLCTGCESTTAVWPLPGPRCTDTPTTNSDPEKCQQCLDQSPIHQYSWLKATGCKFYGACRKKCEKIISLEEKVECLNCLCEGIPAGEECLKQGRTAEECKWEGCQKWICGESVLNWTSCHSY